MKNIWSKYIQPNLFYIVCVAILLPVYIHVVILVLVTLYLMWTKRGRITSALLGNRWLSIFLVYVLVVSLINRNYIGVLISFAYFLLVIFFSNYLRWITYERYLKIMNIIVIGSIFVSLYAIVGYIIYAYTHGYTWLYIFQYANVQTRAEGTFFNPNYYGMFCIFAIVISLYLLFKSEDGSRFNRYYLSAILLNGIAIILTASRMALPTVVVAVAWFFFLTYRQMAWVLVGGGITGALALIIKPDLIPRFSSIAYGFQDRFALWNVGWRIFMSNPLLGRGAMSYMNLYYLYTDKADMHAHQLLINTLADFGIVGIILIALASKPLVKAVVQLYKDKTHKQEFALVSTMILTVFVHGLMDVSIHWTQTGIVFLMVVLPIQQIRWTKKTDIGLSN